MGAHHRRAYRKRKAVVKEWLAKTDFLKVWEKPEPTIIRWGEPTVWIYNQHPVALPSTTQFSVTLSFGSIENKVAEPKVIKTTLLGRYTSKINVL